MFSWVHKNITLLAILLNCMQIQLITADNGQVRIVNGITATRRHKSLVSLQLINANGTYTHNCGASILNSKYMLTAAHCVDNRNASELSVFAGSNDLSQAGTRKFIASYVMHPSYVKLGNNDLAIMEVTQPFEFNDLIGPIVLKEEVVGIEKNVTVAGWGYKYPIRFGSTPINLQEIALKTKKCKDGEVDICAYEFLKGVCGVN